MATDASMAGLVTAIGSLAATEARLFEIVGGWVATTVDDGLAVGFSTISRELGEHALWWRDVLPESVLLEPGAALVPAPVFAAALEAATALEGDAARAGALHHVLLPLLADACRGLPDGERFVRRVRDRVLADLFDAVVDGARASTRVVGADPGGAAAGIAAVAGAVEGAGRP
jgi:hypothetical protein